MLIIPAINCPDFNCVKEMLQKAAEFLPEDSWVQLDIADGKFAPHKTWNNPKDLIKLKTNLEVHLMVEKPEAVIDDWTKTGAKRIIIHLESINSAGSINRSKIFEDILDKCRNSNVELGLAINPETSVENLIPYISMNQSEIRINQRVKFVQILAVDPGASGQKFQLRVLDKIKFLKKNYPSVIIEIDGGMNLETAKLCKEAGANILVAGSYIWDNANPQRAFKELRAI